VARAKRTDRAEARRKYRAYLQAQEEAEAAAASEAESPAGAAAAPGAKQVRGSASRPQPAVQPGVRLGLFAAARAATRTPHYLDDMRNVRSLVFGSNAIWPVLVVCVIAGFYSATRIASKDYATDPIFPFISQFLFYPVPLLPPMMAGFLAPRSTWLAGLIASFIATVTLVAVVGITAVTLSDVSNSIAGTTPSPSAQASLVATQPAASATTAVSSPEASVAPAPTPTPGASAAPANSGSTGTSTTDLFGLLVVLLGQSLAFGALMGALSGWYKRFLSLTSVPRNKPPSRSGGSRPQQRRPATKR
jgi:hypothetical protein